MTRYLSIRVAALALAGFGLWLAAQPAAGKKWYKGNLHTHTLNSDGDSPPAVVARWYKDHGYRFLVLSDHNFFTDPAPLNAELAEAERFALLPGEEVTDRFGARPVHVNGYGIRELVKPSGGASLVATIQGNVDGIRQAGGVPSVNHPNFGWAMTSQDLLAVRDLPLFEIYNGHPTVYNRGGGGAESLEQMWDALLSAGRRIYGIAVDDAHNYKVWGKDQSNPGRGWVVVRAASLNAEDIFAALRAGDFYSSTGVDLADVEVTAAEYRITVRPPRGSKQTTYFIGDAGKLLGTSFEDVAVYRFRGGEKYVRAVVRAANGDDAWTQPAFRK